MADFKLTEVAKKIGLTADQALEKLTEAGEDVAGTGASISVEQMRILGVEPQQMIDRRRERLQQVLERRTRGSMGKEVVVDSRTKSEPAAALTAPTRKISREELLKRKSELNKDVQKVDEERQLRNKADEETETALDDTAAIEAEAPTVEEPVIVELPEIEIPEQEKPVVKEKPPVKEKPAPVEKRAVKEKTVPHEKTAERPSEPAKKTPRPAGPAGYVPRTDQQGRTQRPSGPAAMRNERQDRGGRSDRPDRGGRPDRGPTDRGDRQDRTRPGQQRPTSGAGLAPKSEHLVPRSEDERRRGEKKKETDLAIAAKEEAAKKAKAKVADPKKARDWNKTINEGMEELDIELEIEAPAEDVLVVAEASQTQSQTRGGRPERKMKKKDQRTTPPPTPKPTHITIGETITVADLAGMIAIKATELVKKLFAMGIMATVNQAIDAETATLLSMEYGVEVSTKVLTEDDLLPVYENNPEDQERRPPVVTVMGHVDHGKTSLLDAIRSTSVASREAGGITQHIGAYEAELDGRKITFLDTPGHEAFTSLRARGAQATDIVILVVAANDGVMPQTKEAIDHAKAAGVKIVVAINKIDAENANSDRVRQQLAEYGIISDEWGGEYQFQEISAKKNIGIKDLLERVLLEADILELTGNPKHPAEGIVIESQLDKQRGPVATILVRNGTLHRGDTFLVGSQVAKVRSMYNYRGQVIKEAGISMPVEVMGFSSVPEAGDKILAIADERLAKSIAEIRARHEQVARHSTGNVISLTDFFSMVKQGEIKELNIIIKSDVQGSLEALKSSLLKLTNAEVKVNVVHDATGGITESDVVLAMASKAIIIGFNVRPDTNARNLAEREGVSIELYSVIYKAIEDVKLALEGMLTPDTVERVIGKVEIRQVFSVPKIGKIAGSYVVEGKVTRNALVRVIRDNVVIYDGKLASLKRFTDDVKEVNQGYECGLSIDRYQDIKEGDFLEVYELVEEKRTLEDVAKSEAAKSDK